MSEQLLVKPERGPDTSLLEENREQGVRGKQVALSEPTTHLPLFLQGSRDLSGAGGGRRGGRRAIGCARLLHASSAIIPGSKSLQARKEPWKLP